LYYEYQHTTVSDLRQVINNNKGEELRSDSK
jgi:hypothetical protein